MTFLRHFRRLVLSFLAGLFGGIFCASFILSFNALIGRNGSTDCEYIGYWEPALLLVAAFYGGQTGILFTPIIYLIFLRKGSLSKAVTTFWKVAAIDIFLGCIGALSSPLAAAIWSFFGFFLAVAIVKGTEHGNRATP